ncbi:hypothetical protein HU200_040040 [Digitaria exilis]|uniref:F-box domain-containing protein n=1 Tax=Digitaria exilis TaxID=1010633 RepID=A0A835EK89_9POAL|nr:hypothetical protein HU200_040040 [Digitaria exilis]
MAEAEIDKISELPDDVLLDILGRLVVTAGDVHAVARTSILSRRWRSLPWPQITGVSLDVSKFFIPSDEWQRVRQRRRRRRRAWEQDQRHATAAFTDALARFLEAPASKRVIEKLSLKFFLRRRDDLRRIGELVGGAAAGGVVKSVELEIVVTEMKSVAPELEEQTKLGNGERFGHFLHDCPGAFRSITKLTLKDMWFHDAAELNSNLLRGCNNLQFLTLSSCGIFYPKTLPNADEPSRPPALTIDAPELRLEFLRCDLCDIGGVELVQAPALSGFSYYAKVIEDSAPISFGCTPSLKCLSLGHCQGEDTFVKLK